MSHTVAKTAIFLLLLAAQASAQTEVIYVSNEGDGSVTVLDAHSLEVRRIVSVGGNLREIAALPNRAYVATRNPDGLAVVDPVAGLVSKFHEGPFESPDAVAVASDGEFAYVANVEPTALCSGRGSVVVVDLARDIKSRVCVGPLPAAIALSPNGVFAYVANSGEVEQCGGKGSISILQTATHTVTNSFCVGQTPVAIAFDPSDMSRAYVVNLGDDSLGIIDVNAASMVGTIDVGATPVSLAISADGLYAYVTSVDDLQLAVVDTSKRSVVRVDVFTTATAVLLREDQHRIILSDYLGGSLVVLDDTNLQIANSVPVGLYPISLAAGDTTLATVTSTVTPTATPTPPPNDSCLGAQVVEAASPFTVSANTRSATTSGEEPSPACAMGPPFHSVWYRFTAEGDALVTLDAFGYYPVLSVFAGDCDNLTPVVCAKSEAEFGQATKTDVVVSAGVIYQVMISSAFDIGGPLTFSGSGAQPTRTHTRTRTSTRSVTTTPTSTPTPMPALNDCCACAVDVCQVPGESGCTAGCTVEFDSTCDDTGACIQNTPMPTPTPTLGQSDCCACFEGCVMPSGSSCPSGCTAQIDSACTDAGACEANTPTTTPTLGPGSSDCCQCEDGSCAEPSDASCPDLCVAVFDSICTNLGCMAPTPTRTPTLGPNDCCQCEGNVCAVPSNSACPQGCTVVYDSACMPDGGCVASTPTPTPRHACVDDDDCPSSRVCFESFCRIPCFGTRIVCPIPLSCPPAELGCILSTGRCDLVSEQTCLTGPAVTPTQTRSPPATPTDTRTATSTRSRTATTTPSVTATAGTDTTPTTTAEPTAIPTASASPTFQSPAPSAPPSPTRTPCRGDCDGDGTVLPTEIRKSIEVALGFRPEDECMLSEGSKDRRMTVDKLVLAVRAKIHGCR